MRNEPKLPRRRSIRLKGWDYSQAGGYFVTMVTNRRIDLFGQIINGEVNLNTGGKIIDEVWRSLSARYPMVELGEYVIMPNHLHGIIIIRDNVGTPLVGARQGDAVEQAATRAALTGTDDRGPLVGAPLVGARQGDAVEQAATRAALTGTDDRGPLVGAPLVGARRGDAVEPAATRAALTGTDDRGPLVGASLVGARQEKNPTLGQIIGAFKSISTHEYIMAVRRGDVPSFRERLWQRNYYEHIIRNEKEMSLIHAYIQGNPACWPEDDENPLGL